MPPDAHAGARGSAARRPVGARSVVRTDGDGPAPYPWYGRACVAALGCVARLPSRWQLALGRALGAVLHRAGAEPRAVATANVVRAWPGIGPAARAALVRSSFAHAGMGAIEVLDAWFGDGRRDAERFAFDGAEHVDAALGRGRGVVLVQAHLSCLDVAARPIGARWPVSAVTGLGADTGVGRFAAERRARALRGVVGNDDVRGMLRCLRRGEVLWYSPDVRVPPARGGLAVRWFGQRALTSGATARLAALTGAAVVPYAPSRERGPDGGTRYRLRFDPALDLDPDVARATQQVNDALEARVRACPEQYLWANRRFEPRRARPPSPIPEPKPA